MMDAKIGSFAPNLGLEQIDRLDGLDAKLPVQHDPQLTGQRIRHWTGELFQPATLDQTLRQFAAIHVADPTLLTPTRFESVVRDSARTLRELAEHDQDPSLTEAINLLDQELQLRTLLASYRGLLIRA